jgi:hypothetical protein
VIISRLRPEERAQLSEIENLYVNAQNSTQKVPLGQVSRIIYALETEKIRRRNQFRTITVSAFPAAGLLPSQVFKAALPRLEELHRAMPGDYRFEICGEAEEQTRSFQSMAVVFGLLLAAIYPTARPPPSSARRDGRAAQLNGPARHEALFDARPHAPAPRGDHRGRHRARPGPPRPARRAAVAAAVLRADRRPVVRHLRHPAARPVLYTIVIQDLKLIRWDKSAEGDDAAIVAHRQCDVPEIGKASIRIRSRAHQA